jgi:hypothetical protein
MTIRTGVTFDMQDPNVAEGGADGLVMGKGSGRTAAICRWQGYSASFTVTVELPMEHAYGMGEHGANGITPYAESVGGLPLSGNGAYALECSGALGGTVGVMIMDYYVDEVRIPGLPQILVALSPLASLQFMVAGGPLGVAGAGVARVAMAIPNDPGLLGLEVFSQFLWVDTGAREGISSTNGFMFRVSSRVP